MGKTIAFILLLPFRLIFWGGLAFILFHYLIQWGFIPNEPSSWESRRNRMYELCLQQEKEDSYWKEKDQSEMVHFCKRRTIHSPIDI